MSDSAAKQPIPARAIASILFACCSFFAFQVYGQVFWLPIRFSKAGDDNFHRMRSLLGPIENKLFIGYHVMAVMSLIWCIWSWRTEPRIAAIIATVFAILATLSLFVVT